MDKDIFAYDSLQSLFETNNDDFLNELTLGKLSNGHNSDLYLKDDSKKKIDQLIHRLEYLKYGFGVRTKSVLDNVYSITKITLGEKFWNQLGREYSESFSREYLNLNEIGLGFGSFLKEKKLPEWICQIANLELKIYKSEISPIQKKMEVEEFSSLSASEFLRLRSDVYITSGTINIHENPWIQSPKINYFLIFRNEIQLKHYKVEILNLTENSYNIFMQTHGNSINDLSLKFSQEELIQVFSVIGKNHLLVSKQNNCIEIRN